MTLDEIKIKRPNNHDKKSFKAILSFLKIN